MPATTQRPSVAQTAAGPSHGSMTALQYSNSAWCSGFITPSTRASGISRALTMGAGRPACTSTSKTLSSAAESEPDAWITGFTTAWSSPKASAAMRISWLFIQLALPRRVLISPLCASIRKGWANRHSGKVLVE